MNNSTLIVVSEEAPTSYCSSALTEIHPMSVEQEFLVPFLGAVLGVKSKRSASD